MKTQIYGVLLLLILCPFALVLAGGEVNHYDVKEAKGYRAKKSRDACNKGPFILYPGSLKGNIERLAMNHCWYVVKWKADSDFEWVGDERGTDVRASNLQDALRKVLQKYPLQAQFYMGNHVLAIESRTLKNEL